MTQQGTPGCAPDECESARGHKIVSGKHITNTKVLKCKKNMEIDMQLV